MEGLDEMMSFMDERKRLMNEGRGKTVKLALEKSLLKHILVKYGSIEAFEVAVDKLYNREMAKKGK